MHAGVYKRRTLEKTALYEIAFQHFEEYEKIYPERYEAPNHAADCISGDNNR